MSLTASLLFLLPLANAADWPDLSQAPRPTGGGEKDAALLVGIGDYAFIPDVPGATRNVDDWYVWLTRTRGVPPTSITLLRDSEATVEKMRRYAGEVAASAGDGGTLWVVFVGHGAPTRDGQDGMLVGADAQQDADSLFARSLPQKELLALLAAGRQQRTVAVVDACFSGRSSTGEELVRGVQFVIPSQLVASEKATVLTAGRADQFAGPLPGADRPAFSYLVLGALHGWGDADADGNVTPGEATAYAKDALRMLVKDRTQTPEIAGPDVDAALSVAASKGPDLSAMVLEKRPPVQGGFGFAADQLSLEIPVFTVDTSQAGLGGIDIEVEQRLDRALVTQEDRQATDWQKKNAWCYLAEYGSANPYEQTAHEACGRWEAYIAEKDKLETLLDEDYGKLRDFLELERKPVDQKLAATDAFLGAYGEVDDKRIDPVRRVRAKLAEGKDATLGTTRRDRHGVGESGMFLQLGVQPGYFFRVAGLDATGAFDMAVDAALMVAVKDRGPFLGFELEGAFSKEAIGPRYFGSFKVSTGGEVGQASVAIGPGYAPRLGTQPLAMHEVVELWFQTDDSDMWLVFGPRFELQHYGLLDGLELTSGFIGFNVLLAWGDTY